MMASSRDAGRADGTPLSRRHRQTLLAGAAIASLVAAGLFIVPVTQAQAQERTWTGSQNNRYGEERNWTSAAVTAAPNDVVPDRAGEIAVFDGPAGTNPTVNLNNGTFDPDEVRISGDVDYVIDGGTLQANFNSTTSGNVSVGAAIEGDLSHDGTGTIALSGDNTIGTATILSGTVRLDSGDSLSATTAIFMDGGTLQLDGGNETVATLAGGGGTIQIADRLRLIGNAPGATTTTSAVDITGTGGLAIELGNDDTQILTERSTFTGLLDINRGTLELSLDGGVDTTDIEVARGTLRVDGGALALGTDIEVQALGTFDVDGAEDLGSGTVTALENSTIDIDALAVLSAQSIDNDGTISSAGVLQGTLGNTGDIDASGQIVGAVTNRSDATLEATGDLTIDGSVANDVTATLATGANALTITGNLDNSSAGAAPGGARVTVATGGTLTATQVNNDGGVVLVEGTLTATDRLAQMDGTFVNNATVNGSLIATDGTVQGVGTFADDLTIESAATVGAGQVGGIAVGTETATGALAVTGALDLDGTAEFDLTQADTRTGANDRLVVGSADLTDGTIDVGAAAAGRYRLLESGTDITTAAAATLAADNGGRLYTTGNGRNLNVAVGDTTVQYFDGTDNEGDGTVDGGNGTWDATATNWTTSKGELNDSWQGDAPAADDPSVTAVFQSAAGTVDVAGTRGFGGLQFDVDGVLLQGGTLEANDVDTSEIAVANAGDTATIASDISATGTTGIDKTGAGTLVLQGETVVAGGVEVEGGTLRNEGDVQSTVTVVTGGALENAATAIVADVVRNGGSVTNSSDITSLTNNADATRDRDLLQPRDDRHADQPGRRDHEWCLRIDRSAGRDRWHAHQCRYGHRCYDHRRWRRRSDRRGHPCRRDGPQRQAHGQFRAGDCH